MSVTPSATDVPADRGWLGVSPATLGCLVAIAVLIVPLSLLSQPADSVSEGGKLARLRREHKLAQEVFGKIDATGETVRFATLGLKPVAVVMLWDRVNHYKKVEDWTSLSAALEQLTKFQPHFYSVWDYQAHNLSYNISVEFDDYHDRYAWVIKGIEFLRQGIALNDEEPRLIGRMGWFIGHKIGKSDEKKQFRQLFRDDDAFHERDDPRRTLRDRDNWLVAREKYLAAQALVDDSKKGVTLKTTPLIFHSEPMMMSINYARAIEDEGTFGPPARKAWEEAGDLLEKFLEREIPSSWNVAIYLGQRDALRSLADRRAAELEELLPGAFGAAEQRRREALPAEQRAALDVPAADRTEAQQALAAEAESAVRVTWPMVAREAPDAVRSRAVKLAREHEEASLKTTIIERYRDILNLDFWEATCRAEVTEPAIRFHERVWEADRAYRGALLREAKAAYEEAFIAWHEVLEGSPVLRGDRITADETAEIVRRYKKVLEQLDEPFPKDFILQDMLDKAGPGEDG